MANLPSRKPSERDRNVTVDRVRLEGADFSGRRLEYFCAIASRFYRCTFESMRIEDLCFGGGSTDSVYLECSFDGARLSAGAPGAARFERCSFRNIRFNELFSEKLEFIDCVFSGRIYKGYFNGTVPEDARIPLGRSRNEFHGNDFSATDLIDVGFRTGIDLSLQTLPSGAEYLYVHNGAAALAMAREEVERSGDHEIRKQALTFLQVLELELQGGQRQLFVRPSSLAPRRLRGGAALVFAVLRSSLV